MQWLTIPQIKRRSKTAKGALKVSYKHWCQLYDATAKELRKALKDGNVYFGASYCGLCRYYGSKSHKPCSQCVLGDCLKSNSLYEIAWAELNTWFKKIRDGNWHSWKRACKAVRDKLGELLKPS